MRSFAAIAAVWFACSSGPGFAGDRFYLIDNANDGLFRSDTANVPGDVLVAQLASSFWGDLCPADQDNRLFATRVLEQVIVTLRENDGAIEATLAVDRPIVSLAYDPLGDVLYGVPYDGSSIDLVVIDRVSGSTQLVGSTGIAGAPGTLVALVWDAGTAQLYATTDGGNLYTIDPLGAGASFVGSTGLSSPFGLALNPSDHELYATDAATDSLYMLNRTTGSATLVGGPYTLATFATALSFGNGRPPPPPAVTYCTAKPNSLGCVPAIGFTGLASASAENGFLVTAVNEHNQKPGLLLYGVDGRAALPFQGGILCVAPPVKRTPPRTSGGDHPVLKNCSGAYRMDMNAFAAGKIGGSPDPLLRRAGTFVHCQWWARDANGIAGTSTSDALQYVVGP